MDHRCRRGEYCADYETVEGKKLGRAINATTGFCDTCGKQVQRTLGELPTDYVTLNTLLGKGSTTGGEPVRMTKELPVPIRLHVEALQRDMVYETNIWAASVAEVLRIEWTFPGGIRPGWRLDRACSLLSGAPSAFFALRDQKHTIWEYGQRCIVARDGFDGALALMKLHHKARMFMGHHRLIHRLPVPCPRCEAMGLEREDGSELIECRDCGQKYTWAEYEHLCLALVDCEERKLRVA